MFLRRRLRPQAYVFADGMGELSGSLLYAPSYVLLWLLLLIPLYKRRIFVKT